MSHHFGLGILGGAFDPPHRGHVELARAAREHYGFGRLLVLVVADPGHKQTVAPAETRFELAQLAFEDVPDVEVELDRHARTVDFLEERRPENAIFLVGGDELADFLSWKQPEKVLELASLGVAMRPGVPEDELLELSARLPAPDRISFFAMRPMPVSSREIRERVGRREPIDKFVPPRVADGIERLGLYRDAK